jgi:hypothetical protein
MATMATGSSLHGVKVGINGREENKESDVDAM